MAPSRLAALLLLARCVVGTELPSIQVQGSKLFYPNGTQFIMRGVAYQQQSGAAGTMPSNGTFIDPLADSDRCQQDVPLLAELGTNLIRTYAIDPTANHSACMALLNDAGIYVISDLSEPNLSINRDDPQWTVQLQQRYQQVVDALAPFPNVVGFFAGNEVSNSNNNTAASAFVKAAVRDTKRYISDRGYRWLGVGYAANDDLPIRDAIASYFNCGPAEQAIDFFGYNIYSWCGESSFEASGYNRLIDFFTPYSVPVFLSEYGCNLPGGAAARIFDDTTALYEPNMTDVISGGIIYQYFQESNDYGLVTIGNDGAPTKMRDFAALQTKVRSANPTGVVRSSYSPTATAASCPAVAASSWEASATLPPTPNAQACSCMSRASECVPAPGLKTESYGAIFNYVCSSNQTLCAGIAANASTGVYGPYSMCNGAEQLAYVLDAYYRSMGGQASACDFNGQAQRQTPTGTAANCTSGSAAAGGGGGAGGNGTAAESTAGRALRGGDGGLGVWVHAAGAAAAAVLVVGGLVAVP